ncbi:MAG: hypothetical protein ACLUQB_03955 [Lachnospiraceae bacterium]
MESKIERLLKELTLDEKIGMIHGKGLFETKGVERLGIPPLKLSDGPMGVRNEFPGDSWVPVGNSDDYVSYLPPTAPWLPPGTGSLSENAVRSWERRPEAGEKT